MLLGLLADKTGNLDLTTEHSLAFCHKAGFRSQLACRTCL